MSGVVPFPAGSVAPGGAAPLSSELIRRYDRPVPRYTSYPTAPHFHEGVGHAAYRILVTENGRPFLRSVAAVFDRYQSGLI